MEKKFKIYYTSDVHGYLFPTDYLTTAEKPLGLLNVVQQFEKDANTLVIDGGDIFQGSPYINYFQKKRQVENGIAEVMNTAGYDFITLGNHDFNYGFDFLKENLKQLQATTLAANVEDLAGQVLFPPVIKTLANGLKVGLVGLVTDYVNVWEKPEHLRDVRITDPFAAAKASLAQLKKQVDVTIGIYHGGFEVDLETLKQISATTENIGYRLAQELTFDLLLTAHQHATICGQLLQGTYVLQLPHMAQCFFELTVTVDENRQVTIESTLKEAGEKPHLALAEKLQPLQAEVLTYLDREIGHLPAPILAQSHLELAQFGNPVIELIGEVERLATQADIVVVSMNNNTQALPQDFTVRDLLANYPFSNTLFKLKISGGMLRRMLERTAEYFVVEQGRLAVNPRWLVPKVEHYNYDFYLGIHYQMAISKAFGNRITQLTYQGQPVQETDEFSIALSDYRAFGGGEYLDYQQAEVLQDTNLEIQQLLLDYVEAQSVLEIPKSLDFSVKV